MDIPSILSQHSFQVFVFLLSILVTLQQALSSGYLNSVITTIEKRYEIPSSISGIIASMYEIGNVITVIFVSYLGSRRHIPVWLGIGKIRMSVLPTAWHWIDNYLVTRLQASIKKINKNKLLFVYWFILLSPGCLVMGIGSITFSLPHFLSGPYLLHGSDSNNATANICRAPKLLDQADRDTILQNLPGLDKIKSLTEGK